MKISTKGRYGLRAMIDLAVHSNGEYISLNSIANRQNISLNYLEHAFSSLKKAGVILGHTGANGGYKLAKVPEKITLEEILFILEGDMTIVQPIEDGKESLLQACVREILWDNINEKIKDILQTTTLQDMVKRYHTSE